MAKYWTHDYSDYGQYNVSLLVKDSLGSKAYSNKTWEESHATCDTGVTVISEPLVVALTILGVAVVVGGTGFLLYRRRRIRGTKRPPG